MANPFDQFDDPAQVEAQQQNVFDQFDVQPAVQEPQPTELLAPEQRLEKMRPSMVDMFDKYRSGQMDPVKSGYFEELMRRKLGTQKDVMGIGSEPQVKPTSEDAGLLERTASLAGTAASNLPGSTIDLLNNIGLAAMRPLDTAQALGEVAFGAAQTLIPGKQEDEDKFDAMVGFFKKRYGSLDALTQTIAEDPAGVMADMSALFTGIGGATKVAGTVSKTAPLIEAGEKITKVAAAADPVNLAATATGKVLGGNIAESMFASSSKMGTTKGIPERRAAVEKALDEGLMPTEAGVKVLEGKKAELYDQLNTVIDNATESGGMISRDMLFKNLRDSIDKAKAGPQSATVKKQIFNMMRQLRNEWPKKISPQNVQDIKVSFQQAVKDSAWGQSTPGIKDANKQIARAARELLEDQYPEVKGINKELSEFKNLEKELERAASRIENNNPLGMTKMMTTGFGGAAGGIEGMAAGLGLGLVLDPKVQAKLAILMRKLRSKGIDRSGKVYAAREGMRQAGRIEDELTEENK